MAQNVGVGAKPSVLLRGLCFGGGAVPGVKPQAFERKVYNLFPVGRRLKGSKTCGLLGWGVLGGLLTSAEMNADGRAAGQAF
jgi:hypothetical protein